MTKETSNIEIEMSEIALNDDFQVRSEHHVSLIFKKYILG